MVYTIVLFVGIALIIISLIIFRQSISFIKNGCKVTGTVIRLEKSSDGDSYSPVFKFNTLEGQEIIYMYNTSSSPANWDIGEQVTIVYNANNPNDVQLLTYFGSFGLTIILMSVAMTLIIIGGGYNLTQSFLK